MKKLAICIIACAFLGCYSPPGEQRYEGVDLKGKRVEIYEHQGMYLEPRFRAGDTVMVSSKGYIMSDKPDDFRILETIIITKIK